MLVDKFLDTVQEQNLLVVTQLKEEMDIHELVECDTFFTFHVKVNLRYCVWDYFVQLTT